MLASNSIIGGKHSQTIKIFCASQVISQTVVRNTRDVDSSSNTSVTRPNISPRQVIVSPAYKIIPNAIISPQVIIGKE